MKKTFSFVEPFLNKDGISGYEGPISEYYQNHVKKSGAKITRDGFGSVIANIGLASGPKIMLAAHMDEVGFVVERLEKDGMLRLSPIGGHWTHTILASQVKVVTTDNKIFYGVIGSTSVHVLQPEQRNKVLEFKDLYVDLGFNSSDEVLKAGIDVGDQVIRISEAKLLANGDKVMAKAIDNRLGVAIVAKVFEDLSDTKIACNLFGVATAQEEVGLRGAKASINSIKPDLAITIDTTVSHDTPNIIPGDTKLGKGVAITMKDNSAIANPKLANLLFTMAKEAKVPVYKYVSQGGGNDSGETQYSQAGIPVVTIAIPTRYLHTPFEIASLKDFEAIVKLLVLFIKKFDKKMLESFHYKF